MSENNATRSTQSATEPDKKPKQTPTQQAAQQAQSQTKSTPSINVNNLGYFLDGWAEIVENIGDKEHEVIKSVLQQLLARKMPDITTRGMFGYVSQLSSERRNYIINRTSPGATTAINVAKHGSDLYVSWRTFIKPVINAEMIVLVTGISFLIGIAIEILGGASSGRMFSIWDLIVNTIVMTIFATLIAALIGRFTKGDFLAFFFKVPNIFDAEDITAMGLSTHKSLLRALDSVGIDSSKLRPKQDFKGGRKGELV